MEINRKPEIKLVKTLHAINALYGGKKKLTKNILNAFDQIELSEESKNKINDKNLYFPFDVKFNIPEKTKLHQLVEGGYQIGETNDDRINISQMKSYSQTLKKLFIKHLEKKYEGEYGGIDQIRLKEMKEEIREFAKSFYIAVGNPMVYGKCIEQFFDDKQMEKFSKLTYEEQNAMITRLMYPVDSKVLFKQAVNKINKDLKIDIDKINKDEKILIKGKINTEDKNDDDVENLVDKSTFNDVINKLIDTGNLMRRSVFDYFTGPTYETLDSNSNSSVLVVNKNIEDIHNDYENSIVQLMRKTVAYNKANNEEKENEKSCGKQ